jgi:folate-binding protein YgfZ
MKTIPRINAQRDWLIATGEDAVRFLSGMWTCDIKRASDFGAGATGRGYLLNTKGKLVSEAQFLVLENKSILFSIPVGFGAAVQEFMEQRLVADAVELQLAKPFTDVWILPELPEVFYSLFSVDQFKILDWKIPGAQDKVYSSLTKEGVLLVPKMQFSSSHFEIWVNGNLPRNFEDKIPLKFDDSVQIDKWAFGKIIPQFGIDLLPEDLVLEFPHGDAISFHKGCYIGQEVVARATFRGRLNRGFARMTFERPPLKGFIYSSEQPDQPVGKISSTHENQGLGLVRLSLLDSSFFSGTEKYLFQNNSPEQGSLNKITRVDLAHIQKE